jgi:hypothetical protein
MLLTVISVLIILFSLFLIYHTVTDDSVDRDQPIAGDDISISDVSSEIDDVLLDENDEIDIGEMI